MLNRSGESCTGYFSANGANNGRGKGRAKRTLKPAPTLGLKRSFPKARGYSLAVIQKSLERHAFVNDLAAVVCDTVSHEFCDSPITPNTGLASRLRDLRCFDAGGNRPPPCLLASWANVSNDYCRDSSYANQTCSGKRAGHHAERQNQTATETA